MKSACSKPITIPINKERAKTLRVLQRALGIRFSDATLLNLSLMHKSYTGGSRLRSLNNERLEFLGDAILGLVVTERLYRVRMRESEGYLAKCKAHIVSKKILTQVAHTLALDRFLLVGRGEEMSSGRSKSAILADALEALIGAYYLDSGFSHVSSFVLNIFDEEISKVLNDEHNKDYKTILQEYVRQMFKQYPQYKIVRRSGPEHKQVFWVEVAVQNKSYGPASGLNKKDAEQAAAQIAYQQLTATRAPLPTGQKRPRPRP